VNSRLAVALLLGIVLAAGAAALLWLRGGTGGPRVAAENPCDAFPSLDGALTAWMQEWRRLEPALTCEHFERLTERRPSVTPAGPWADPEGRAASAPARWRDAAGRRLLLPVADGTLRLVDLQASTSRVVLGPSSPGGTWRDAGWMDERTFMAAGEEPGATARTVAPVLAVMRLDSNTVTLYRGPVEPEARLEGLQRPAVP
jgi:hypothetical protein